MRRCPDVHRHCSCCIHCRTQPSKISWTPRRKSAHPATAQARALAGPRPHRQLHGPRGRPAAGHPRPQEQSWRATPNSVAAVCYREPPPSARHLGRSRPLRCCPDPVRVPGQARDGPSRDTCGCNATELRRMRLPPGNTHTPRLRAPLRDRTAPARRGQRGLRQRQRGLRALSSAMRRDDWLSAVCGALPAPALRRAGPPSKRAPPSNRARVLQPFSLLSLFHRDRDAEMLLSTKLAEISLLAKRNL